MTTNDQVQLLDYIRDLTLTPEDKLSVAKYIAEDKIDDAQNDEFKKYLKRYQGRIYSPFRNKLYDLYIYSLIAQNDENKTIWKFLTTPDFTKFNPTNFAIHRTV